MQNTFLQRLILAAVAGLAMALLIEAYRHVVLSGEESINGKFRKKPAAQVR